MASRAANLLWAARRRAGLTQRELARLSEIPQPAISRIERGVVSPTIDTLDRLVRACGMGLHVLDAAGEGLDRTLIRERLRMTTGERARRAAVEWNRTAAFRRDPTAGR